MTEQSKTEIKTCQSQMVSRMWIRTLTHCENRCKMGQPLWELVWSFPLKVNIDFSCSPCGSPGKESTCNVGDLGSIPRSGRSPGEGNHNPLQYSGLENSMNCISTWGHGAGHDWVTFTFTFFMQPRISTLRWNLSEMKTDVHIKAWTLMFMEYLLVTTKKWK